MATTYHQPDFLLGKLKLHRWWIWRSGDIWVVRWYNCGSSTGYHGVCFDVPLWQSHHPTGDESPTDIAVLVMWCSKSPIVGTSIPTPVWIHVDPNPSRIYVLRWSGWFFLLAGKGVTTAKEVSLHGELLCHSANSECYFPERYKMAWSFFHIFSRKNGFVLPSRAAPLCYVSQ